MALSMQKMKKKKKKKTRKREGKSVSVWLASNIRSTKHNASNQLQIRTNKMDSEMTMRINSAAADDDDALKIQF